MQTLLEFLSLSDPNVRYVVLGSVLLGISAGVVGCFSFLRKRALIGDAVAHSILPGVCLAYILTATKSPLILLSGALVSGWLSLLVIDVIGRHSKLKPDTAIGLVLSVFFGIGILLLTSIQHSGSASQAGLDTFLFGKAASMSRNDVITFSSIGALLILIVVFFYKEFRLISFNPDYAKVLGLPVRFLEFVLATITVLAVAVGIQAVGVVLMAALLITPATAARFWTESLKVMIILAALFGAVSGIFGSYISYVAPQMPTGPWIVVCLTTLALISIIWAPGKGLLARARLRRQNRSKILQENILKTFYKLGEVSQTFDQPQTEQSLMKVRAFIPQQLKQGLQQLTRKGLLQSASQQSWILTSNGLDAGQRVTRLHRLWELYLNQRLHLKPDHVHHDADAIEHLITPELEAQLEQELGFPERDPHDTHIPTATNPVS